ncbi:MAG: T9SS type A sorting domain-containing protein, partial [Flavobacteriales bacterium]|nr:T9SS type A sorting domain-containing protein [Flavobacteriales bacterium]
TIYASTCGFNNGSACVNVIGGVAPFVIQWDDPATTVGSCAMNLFAGVYNPFVSDANGCFFTMPVIVNDLTGPTIDSLTTMDLLCFGDANGTATVFSSGGTAPYTYVWTNGAGDTIGLNANIIFGLSGGTYTSTVIDGNGCIVGQSFTINEPLMLVSAITGSTDVDCFGACNGTASVAVGNGVPPYSYNWSPGGQTSANPTGLCAGMNNVIITDNNGCTTVNSISIAEPLALTLSITSNNVLCNGACVGDATASVLGGTLPYTYQWDDPGFQTSITANNLCAGLITVTITDNAGCIITDSVTMINVSGPIIDSVTWTDVICAGDSNGTATVTASGVSLPLTYFWTAGSDTVGVNVTTVFGLWGGTYSITVLDANGCITGASVTINEPSPLASAIISSNGASCNGICDGSVTVMVGGGSFPYSYLWTDGQTTTTATGLCAGTHNVVITDGNNCSTVNSVVILQPSALTLTDSIVDVSCNGNSDGSIYLTVSGGTPFYSYIWTPNIGNGPIVTNLSAQAYTVAVTDVNGCVFTQTYTVNEPIILGASGSTTPSSCGGSNGTGIVYPSGGTPPYSFLWDNPTSATTDTVTGLLARDPYFVAITDANGCTFIISLPVFDNAGPVIDSIIVVNVACFGDSTGVASVVTSGGTAPFTYLWDDPLNQNTPTASMLTAGVYAVTVTDLNGCTVVSIAAITENPQLQLITSGDTSICPGDSVEISATGAGGSISVDYQYVWSTGITTQTQWVSPTMTSSYTLHIVDDLGCQSSPATFFVSVFQQMTLSFVYQDSICSGDSTAVTALATGGSGLYIYLWNTGATTSSITVAPVTSTSYSVTITDNCSPGINDSVTVAVYPPLIAFITGGFTICEGDSSTISYTLSGGSGPYTYVWGTGATTTSITVSPDSTTAYTVISSDACAPDDTVSIVVTVEVCLSIETRGNENGTLTIYPNPSTGNLTIELETRERDQVIVEIFHFTGALVYARSYPPRAGRVLQTLDLDDLSKGIYFIRVRSEEATWSRKIVLE